MLISKQLKLNIGGHKDISFVDISLNNDTKLFVDPYLIETNNDILSRKASKTISSFFSYMFYLHEDYDKNKKEIGKIFSNCHEINDTKLGYGNGKNGKGKTKEGLIKYFSNLPKLLDNSIPVNKELDILYFFGGVAEDCISDIITNIIFDILNEFTIEQVKKWGVEELLQDNIEYSYWDSDNKTWLKKARPRLIIRETPILLVPKQFVCKKFCYNADHYFRHKVAEYLIEIETVIEDDGTKIKILKKDIYKRLKSQGIDKKEISFKITRDNPKLLVDYQNNMYYYYRDRQMSDEELDKLIYCF